MKDKDIFIEVDYYQKNKSGNSVCGDCFMSQRLIREGRTICILSDGLGSGIKASVLSNLTATMAMNYTVLNENIFQTAFSIISTLPQDKISQVGYSTFCILDIDRSGKTKAIEYESPRFYLFRQGKTVEISRTKIHVERQDLNDSFLWISEFQLEQEDRLICFTDGVSQSGMGSTLLPAGWGERVREYITDLLRQHPNLSAKEMAHKIVIQAEKNDGYTLVDDTSCCVVYRRVPRNLLICTGPPYDETKDRYLAESVKRFQGKKILCGGTTAQIISRELDRPLKAEAVTTKPGTPPFSTIEGIDLVTEGILTLSKVERLLSGGTCLPPYGPAEKIFQLLQDSDRISFLVGTRINMAHQNPDLPVELEIRRNIVKKIKYLLETRYLKDIEIHYL